MRPGPEPAPSRRRATALAARARRARTTAGAPALRTLAAGLAARALAATLVVPLAPACVTAETRYGRPVPDPEGIVVGRTTRAEVLARLGPPEEYEQPTPDFGRAWDPQQTRVLAERDLFGREVCTWVQEERRDRYLILVPFATLYARYAIDHRADRLMVVFDGDGLVRAVSLRREIEP